MEAVSRPAQDLASVFPGDDETARRCRELNWAATSLGAPESWSPALRTAVRMMFTSPFPILLWCGADLSLVYNDGYRPILGTKHPRALGRPGSEVWEEIWPHIEHMFHWGAEDVKTFAENARFEMNRGDGVLEDAWFTYAVSPIREEDGRIVAFFNPAAETTLQVIAERQLEQARAAAEHAERRLREVFAQAPAFLAVLSGPTHVFDFVNDAYQRLVNSTSLVGRRVEDALPEVVEQGFIEILDRVYSSGEPFVGREIPVMLPGASDDSREMHYLDFVYQPLTNADGRIGGIVAHGSDVTEGVTARKVIEGREAQFRFLADSIPVQVWTSTPDGQLDYVNEGARHYFGVPVETLKGTGWQQAVHADDLARLLERWTSAMASGEPYQAEFRLRHHSGEYRWHLARGHAQRDESGKILRWYGTNTDIEEAKRYEAELQRLTNEATEANRAKGDFLAAMSHELRTPLNAIGGYAQLIELGVRGPVTPEQVEDLQKIQRSKAHLNTLVGGVLAFAKGGTGRLELLLQEVAVDSLLESVLDMVAPQLAERNLRLVRGEVPLGLHVWADEDKTRQILLNLLANALKFTPQGGTIEVSVSADHTAARIAVRDTGIGVPADRLEKIFEPFVQASRAIHSRDGGVGLGLAISRQLARAMEGELTVESREGVGSVFVLTLPITVKQAVGESESLRV